eukprot:sb/3469671/
MLIPLPQSCKISEFLPNLSSLPIPNLYISHTFTLSTISHLPFPGFDSRPLSLIPLISLSQDLTVAQHSHLSLPLPGFDSRPTRTPRGSSTTNPSSAASSASWLDRGSSSSGGGGGLISPRVFNFYDLPALPSSEVQFVNQPIKIPHTIGKSKKSNPSRRRPGAKFPNPPSPYTLLQCIHPPNAVAALWSDGVSERERERERERETERERKREREIEIEREIIIP